MTRIVMKRIPLCISMIFGLALAGSCVLDRGGETPADGDLHVQFSVHASGSGGTRSIQPADEELVETIDVLAFVADANNEYRYAYKASTVSVSESDGAEGREVTVTVTARSYSAMQQFVVLVNASQELAAAGIILNEKLADAVGKITCSAGGGEWPARNNGAATFKAFPMYAKTIPQVVNANTGSIGNYPLIRMVAKVNVKLHDSVTNFKLVNASLFNYKTAGYVAYDFSGFSGTTASTPAVPASGDHTGDPIVEPTVYYAADYANDARGVISESIYLYESGKILTTADRTRGTALVIGGYYGANTTDMVYYRIDLKTTADVSSAISTGVVRNWEYNVTVQSVAAAGFESALKAYLGDKPIEFTVEVTPWGENWEIPLEWEVPLQEASNCYIMESKKTIAIPIMGQIQRAIDEGHLPSAWIDESMNLKGELIWSDGADRNEVVKYYTVNAYKSNENKYGVPILTVAANFGGNAVVGVYDDANGNGVRDSGEGFLWSWHIWVLESGNFPQEIAGLMDRDLGSTRAGSWLNQGAVGDPCLGLWYQWGRKDPISSPAINKPAINALGEAVTFTNNAGNTLAVAINNPLNIISNWDGTESSWSSSPKSVFDPCPAGWMVPPYSAMSVFAGRVSDFYGVSDANGNFAPFYKSLGGAYAGVYYICIEHYHEIRTRNLDPTTQSYFWQSDWDRGLAGSRIIRCTKDESYVPFVASLSTDSDGSFFEADGTTYDINVTSNTAWMASIKRGTNEVTQGASAIIGHPLISALNGGNVNAYISGGTHGVETVQTLTITTEDIASLPWGGQGDVTIMFYDRTSGASLGKTTFTVGVVIEPDYWEIDYTSSEYGRTHIYMLKTDQPDDGNNTWYDYNNVPFGALSMEVPPLGPQNATPNSMSCAAVPAKNSSKPWRLPTTEEYRNIISYMTTDGRSHTEFGFTRYFMYWSATSSNPDTALGHQPYTTGTVSTNKEVVQNWLGARCIRDAD